MKKKLGVTLIELVITLGILAFSATVFTNLIVMGIDIWDFYRERNSVKANAQRAMSRMVTEIRKINLGNSNDYKVESNHFQFRSTDPMDAVLGFQMDVDSGKLFFYDSDAYSSGLYSADYVSNYYESIDGIDVLKFDLVDVGTLEISYFGIDPGNGTYTTYTNDAQFTNIADGNKRLVKIYMTTVVDGKLFSLGSTAMVRNY